LGVFTKDEQVEANFYHKAYKHYLDFMGIDCIYVRYDDNSPIYQDLQKKNDIDIITDDGHKNMTISLKVVKAIYKQIFYETISNCNKNTPGWGIYSKADRIDYSMGDYSKGFPTEFKLIQFTKDNILNVLNLTKYPKGYGETRDIFGNLLYRTEGCLIPIRDFEHEIIYLNTELFEPVGVGK